MTMIEGTPPKPEPIEKTDPEIAQFFERLVAYQVEQKKRGKMSWFSIEGFSYGGAKRNDPCPCGSGKKFKKCCLIELERKS